MDDRKMMNFTETFILFLRIVTKHYMTRTSKQTKEKSRWCNEKIQKRRRNYVNFLSHLNFENDVFF